MAVSTTMRPEGSAQGLVVWTRPRGDVCACGVGVGDRAELPAPSVQPWRGQINERHRQIGFKRCSTTAGRRGTAPPPTPAPRRPPKFVIFQTPNSCERFTKCLQRKGRRVRWRGRGGVYRRKLKGKLFPQSPIAMGKKMKQNSCAFKSNLIMLHWPKKR